MRRLLMVLFFGLLVLGFEQSASAVVLTVDPEDSFLRFKASSFGFFEVEGEFKGFSVALDLGEDHRIKRLSVSVDSNSVFTHNSIRDRSLRRDKYLNARAFHYMTFQMDKHTRVNEKVITGFVMIKGKKKAVSVPVTISYLKSNETNQYVLSIECSSFMMNRHDFDVSGLPLFISESVELSFKFIMKMYGDKSQA